MGARVAVQMHRGTDCRRNQSRQTGRLCRSWQRHMRSSARPRRGRVTKHHRFLLRLHLNQIDALDAAMATLDTQVEANLGPFRTAVELIMSIPHQEPQRPRHRLRDSNRHEPVPFGRTSHPWAGICPRNDESAGKRRSTACARVLHGSKRRWQCAWAAVKRKNSYLQAQFYQIKARRRLQEGDHGRLQPPSLPLSTTCSRMGRCTRTSAAITSIAVCSTDKQKQRLVKRLS